LYLSSVYKDIYSLLTVVWLGQSMLMSNLRTSPLYQVHYNELIYLHDCALSLMKHLIFYNKEFLHKHITVCVLYIYYIYMRNIYIKTVITKAWFGSLMLWPATNCCKDSTQEWCIDLCYIHIYIIFLVHLYVHSLQTWVNILRKETESRKLCHPGGKFCMCQARAAKHLSVLLDAKLTANVTTTRRRRPTTSTT